MLHRYLGGVLLEGGSDTSSSYLQTVALAMAAYPEVQKKAQAEIDRVVGRDRAPTLDDLPELPYIQALIKEVHGPFRVLYSPLMLIYAP